jgi:hypothetical protein
VRDGDFVIRPKRKHGRDTSPYLLDRLHPVLVVEKPAIEYWTNEEGTVVIDGVVYSTVTRYIRQRLGDSGGAKKLAFSRIKQHKLVPRYGRRRAGNVEQFYAISDLDRICADLLEPRADEDGILVIDGKKFITAGRYVKQVGAGKAEVPKKIKQQNLVYRIGRDAKGDRRKFYALSELDRIYRDYSNTERAGQDGVLVIDGVACITVGPFAVSIGARDDTVQRYIDKYGLRPRKGTDSRGHERDFYIVTELDQACCGYLLRKRSSAKQRG